MLTIPKTQPVVQGSPVPNTTLPSIFSGAMYRSSASSSFFTVRIPRLFAGSFINVIILDILSNEKPFFFLFFFFSFLNALLFTKAVERKPAYHTSYDKILSIKSI